MRMFYNVNANITASLQLSLALPKLANYLLLTLIQANALNQR